MSINRRVQMIELETVIASYLVGTKNKLWKNERLARL